MKARVIQKEVDFIEDNFEGNSFIPAMVSGKVLEFKLVEGNWYECLTDDWAGFHYHISWLEPVK